MLLGVAVVARLHTRHYVIQLAALAIYDEVVGQFDSVPMLVTVHSIISADDGGHHAGASCLHMLLQVDDKALAGHRVGVAAVHEAVDVAVGDAIQGGDIDELLEVVKRRVNAAGGREAHQVQALAAGLGITVRRFDSWVLQDGIVVAGAVDLHQVLIYHAPGADVQMARLRVAHLSVRKPHVLARSLQLGMRRAGGQVVHIRGGRL